MAWAQVFSADVYDLTFDGSYWWTTEGGGTGGGVTVTKRDLAGTALFSFEANNTIGSKPAFDGAVRGITWDGSHLWVTGNGDIEPVVKYTTGGAYVSHFSTGDYRRGNDGLAWDGSEFLLVEGGEVERWSTGGVRGSSFVPPTGSTFRGVDHHDGAIYIVSAGTDEVVVTDAAGSLIKTIAVSSAIDPSGIYVADDGTLYISQDGVGVWRYVESRRPVVGRVGF